MDNTDTPEVMPALFMEATFDPLKQSKKAAMVKIIRGYVFWLIVLFPFLYICSRYSMAVAYILAACFICFYTYRSVLWYRKGRFKLPQLYDVACVCCGKKRRSVRTSNPDDLFIFANRCNECVTAPECEDIYGLMDKHRESTGNTAEKKTLKEVMDAREKRDIRIERVLLLFVLAIFLGVAVYQWSRYGAVAVYTTFFILLFGIALLYTFGIGIRWTKVISTMIKNAVKSYFE